MVTVSFVLRIFPPGNTSLRQKERSIPCPVADQFMKRGKRITKMPNNNFYNNKIIFLRFLARFTYV